MPIVRKCAHGYDRNWGVNDMEDDTTAKDVWDSSLAAIRSEIKVLIDAAMARICEQISALSAQLAEISRCPRIGALPGETTPDADISGLWDGVYYNLGHAVPFVMVVDWTSGSAFTGYTSEPASGESPEGCSKIIATIEGEYDGRTGAIRFTKRYMGRERLEPIQYTGQVSLGGRIRGGWRVGVFGDEFFAIRRL